MSVGNKFHVPPPSVSHPGYRQVHTAHNIMYTAPMVNGPVQGATLDPMAFGRVWSTLLSYLLCPFEGSSIFYFFFDVCGAHNTTPCVHSSTGPAAAARDNGTMVDRSTIINNNHFLTVDSPGQQQRIIVHETLGRTTKIFIVILCAHATAATAGHNRLVHCPVNLRTGNTKVHRKIKLR